MRLLFYLERNTLSIWSAPRRFEKERAAVEGREGGNAVGMATATERKFTNLRKRLDQLGYRQSLGVESLPLVEKLFGDLLQTTESLKTAKQQLGRQQEQKTVWEQQVREVNSKISNLTFAPSTHPTRWSHTELTMPGWCKRTRNCTSSC